MPDLEIALLRLPFPTDRLRSDHGIGVILTEARTGSLSSTDVKHMEYYMQVEDPAMLYIVAEWPSAQAHYEGWVPTEANEAVMKALQDVGTMVIGLVHVQGVTWADWPGEQAPVVSIARFFVDPDQRERFYEAWSASTDTVRAAVWKRPGQTEGYVTGGWTVEGEDTKLFVVLSPWASVQDHANHGYAIQRDFLTGFDIKHVQKLRLGTASQEDM